MIDYFLPHVAGLLTYVFLKILQKQGRLKRFDKYLWSPFVVGFALVDLCLMTGLNYSRINPNGFGSGWSNIRTILIYSQGLWLALLCYSLAVFYRKRFFLNLSYLFTLISILLPLVILFFLSLSID